MLELFKSGLIKIGSWTFGMESASERLKFIRDEKSSKAEFPNNSLKNKNLTIITALVESSSCAFLPLVKFLFNLLDSFQQAQPYTMLKLEEESLSGNDRYEGYAVDLIHELSILLEFNYVFVEQTDGHYGNYDESTGKWDGMIGKVMSGVSVRFSKPMSVNI